MGKKKFIPLLPNKKIKKWEELTTRELKDLKSLLLIYNNLLFAIKIIRFLFIGLMVIIFMMFNNLDSIMDILIKLIGEI
ncbi:hypothetical protein [Bartonella sp. DGB1]|uniref:hypothetical protein n=1 Tax=Bartonella sp. DGB1 TaxID=3239807 RepID=UPI0035241979